MGTTRSIVLGAALAAALAVAPAAADVSPPSLRLVDRAPLTLRGAGFEQRERVRVTAEHAGERTARVVRATATGGFAVVFSTVTVTDPCSLEATAVGSRGSRATLKLPPRLCPMPLRPGDQ